MQTETDTAGNGQEGAAMSGDRDAQGQPAAGNPGRPSRPPPPVSRIAALLEGIRQRFDKATAEEAIAEAVRTCPQSELRHYLLAVVPKGPTAVEIERLAEVEADMAEEDAEEARLEAEEAQARESTGT